MRGCHAYVATSFVDKSLFVGWWFCVIPLIAWRGDEELNELITERTAASSFVSEDIPGLLRRIEQESAGRPQIALEPPPEQLPPERPRIEHNGEPDELGVSEDATLTITDILDYATAVDKCKYYDDTTTYQMFERCIRSLMEANKYFTSECRVVKTRTGQEYLQVRPHYFDNNCIDGSGSFLSYSTCPRGFSMAGIYEHYYQDVWEDDLMFPTWYHKVEFATNAAREAGEDVPSMGRENFCLPLEPKYAFHLFLFFHGPLRLLARRVKDHLRYTSNQTYDVYYDFDSNPQPNNAIDPIFNSGQSHMFLQNFVKGVLKDVNTDIFERKPILVRILSSEGDGHVQRANQVMQWDMVLDMLATDWAEERDRVWTITLNDVIGKGGSRNESNDKYKKLVDKPDAAYIDTIAESIAAFIWSEGPCDGSVVNDLFACSTSVETTNADIGATFRNKAYEKKVKRGTYSQFISEQETEQHEIENIVQQTNMSNELEDMVGVPRFEKIWRTCATTMPYVSLRRCVSMWAQSNLRSALGRCSTSDISDTYGGSSVQLMEVRPAFWEVNCKDVSVVKCSHGSSAVAVWGFYRETSDQRRAGKVVWADVIREEVTSSTHKNMKNWFSPKDFCLPMAPKEQFNSFLSHRGSIKPVVRAIKHELRLAGSLANVYFDFDNAPQIWDSKKVPDDWIGAGKTEPPIVSVYRRFLEHAMSTMTPCFKCEQSNLSMPLFVRVLTKEGIGSLDGSKGSYNESPFAMSEWDWVWHISGMPDSHIPRSSIWTFVLHDNQKLSLENFDKDAVVLYSKTIADAMIRGTCGPRKTFGDGDKYTLDCYKADACAQADLSQCGPKEYFGFLSEDQQ